MKFRVVKVEYGTHTRYEPQCKRWYGWTNKFPNLNKKMGWGSSFSGIDLRSCINWFQDIKHHTKHNIEIITILKV